MQQPKNQTKSRITIMQANPDDTYIIQEWNREIRKGVTFSGAGIGISTTGEGGFHQQTLVLLQSNF